LKSIKGQIKAKIPEKDEFEDEKSWCIIYRFSGGGGCFETLKGRIVVDGWCIINNF
jgi:hypothetical protein